MAPRDDEAVTVCDRMEVEEDERKRTFGDHMGGGAPLGDFAEGAGDSHLPIIGRPAPSGREMRELASQLAWISPAPNNRLRRLGAERRADAFSGTCFLASVRHMCGDEQSVSVCVQGDSILGQECLRSMMWPWSVERLGLPCVGLAWGGPGETFKVQGAYASEPHRYEDLNFQEVGLVAEDFGRGRPAWPDRCFSLTLFPEYSPDVGWLRLRVVEVEGSQEFQAQVTLRPRSEAGGCQAGLDWWERQLEGLSAKMQEWAQPDRR